MYIIDILCVYISIKSILKYEIYIKNPKLKWNKNGGMLCMLYTSHGTSAGWTLTVRNKIQHF